MPTSNRPLLRPGSPTTASVVSSTQDDLALSALRDAEASAPPFVPSIQNEPLAPPAAAPAEAPAAATAAEPPAAASGPKPEEKTPVERWREALEAAKITEAEALTVLKSVIQKGFYEKEYPLWKGLVKIVFRTRDAHHVLRVRRALEELEDRSEFSISQTMFRANVAGSLASYQNQSLPFASLDASSALIEEAYFKRYDFVGKLPGPVFEQITVALAHFDRIVAAACAEGAAQGF